MNCFNNNAPKLSSADKTRDIKAKAIFKANVADYQQRDKRHRTKCSNFNGKVGFYNNGKLRNTRSYDKFTSLNRGSALCVDGAYEESCQMLPNFDSENILLRRGLETCKKSTRTQFLTKLQIGKDSVFTRFSGFSFFPAESGAPLSGFTVLNSWNVLENGTAFDWPPFYNKLPHYDASGVPVVVLDPSDNLFGTDFCASDMTNKAIGPNRYMTFASNTIYVKASGQLFKPDGSLMTCDDEDVPKQGDIVVGGVSSLYNWMPTPPSTVLEKINSWQWWWFTGLGTVVKTCCGAGPNGEPHWFSIFIKMIYGDFTHPQLLPLKASLIHSDQVFQTLTLQLSVEGLTNVHTFSTGGVWAEGSLPNAFLTGMPFGNPQYRGTLPYGGGLGIIHAADIDSYLKDTITPKATMGWNVSGVSTASPADRTTLSSMKKEPYTVILASGRACTKNLLFGNNTEQNYMVSYNPKRNNVRFNIDEKLYTYYNV